MNKIEARLLEGREGVHSGDTLPRAFYFFLSDKDVTMIMKGNQLCYLGIKNSVVSTNLSRVNFKILLSHNPSSHEEFSSQYPFCI